MGWAMTMSWVGMKSLPSPYPFLKKEEEIKIVLNK
jgi:hypothetical protein